MNSNFPGPKIVLRIEEEKVTTSASQQYPIDDLIPIDILKNSTKLEIANVEVYFPFNPYDVQKDFMKYVIQTLQQDHNALLQSPTGTGKTLSLLCATLSWLRQQRQGVQENQQKDGQGRVKIIYASRTHSQLSQVVQQLKATVFQPKICVLSSREKSCIKPEFKDFKGDKLNKACLKATAQIEDTNTDNTKIREICHYFSEGQSLQLSGKFSRQVMDIEESRVFGIQEGFCPFYFERDRKDNADIIFMPYNYLLQNQFSNMDYIANSIIIIDEAHNVAGVAEDGFSYKINSEQIFDADQEMIKRINAIEEDYDSKNFGTIKNLHQSIKSFGEYMKKLKTDSRLVNLNNASKEKSFTLNSVEIFEIVFANTKDDTIESNFSQKGLFSTGIQQNDFNSYYDNGQILVQRVKEKLKKSMLHFQKWLNFIKHIGYLFQKHIYAEQQSHGSVINDFFNNPLNHIKLIITLDEEDMVELKMQCLDPGVAFKYLMKKRVKSILLTSGTLTPFSSWEGELKIPFKVKEQCGHVLDIYNNISAGVLMQGQNGSEFNFSFSNRENVKMYDDLGLMLINMCDRIPNGVLVIFRSYNLMDYCKYRWRCKERQILSRLDKVKKCFWEPRNTKEMKQIFQQYAVAARLQTGAIMFAVCRAKVAEGIDFSDELCRAVFIVGVPYLPFKDKLIKLKMDYLKQIYNLQDIGTYRNSVQTKQFPLNNEFERIKPNDWYQQQAIRATNQALGRVIRHINDYGRHRAIYLCDSRFSEPKIRDQISSWVLPVLKNWLTFKIGYNSTIQFFKSKSKRITNQIVVKEKQEDEIDSDDQREVVAPPAQKKIKQEFKQEEYTYISD